MNKKLIAKVSSLLTTQKFQSSARVLLVDLDDFNEAFDAGGFGDGLARVVVQREAAGEVAGGGEGTRRAAVLAAAAARPVDAQAAPLAGHVAEAVDHQARRPALRHRVPHVALLAPCAPCRVIVVTHASDMPDQNK
ncbi:unnamed protein product [Colias eurytheme]|nr:unnamed protein product [Colias eurytheme]